MIKKHKGGISIFLIIIVMSTVIFGGVFVDLTRVLVAKNRVRTATESAVRSTLAGYSENLASEWGLFGIIGKKNIDPDNIKADFDKYLKINLDTRNKENKANLINYDIKSTRLIMEKPLGEPKVFSQKIDEYSKYRAPVSLTVGVVEKFKAILGKNNEVLQMDIGGTVESKFDKMKTSFSDIDGISQYLNTGNVEKVKDTEDSEDKNKLDNIREAFLDELRANANHSIDDSKKKVVDYKKSIKDYNEKSDEIDTKTQELKNSMSDADVFTDDEKENISEDTGSNNYDDSDAKAKTAEVRNKSNEVIAAAENSENVEAEALRRSVNEKIDEAKVLAKEYNELQNEFNKKYDNINSALSFAQGVTGKTAKDALKYDTEKKMKELKEEIEKISNNIAEKTKKLTELAPIPNETDVRKIEKYVSDLGKELDNLYMKFGNPVTDTEAALDAVNGSNIECPEMKKSFNEYINKPENQGRDIAFDELLKYYSDKFNKLEKDAKADRKKINDSEKLTVEIEKLTAKTLESDFKFKEFVYNNKDKILDAVDTRKKAIKKAKEYNKKIDEIKNINVRNGMGIDKIENFPEKALEITKSTEKEEDKLNFSGLIEKIEEAKELINSLFEEKMPSEKETKKVDLENRLGKSKIGVFDKLWDEFTKLGEALNSPLDKFYLVDYVMNKCTYLTSQTSRNHYFKYGEVEYIIYGYESQVANIMAAVAEVTILRFAINAVNYWITTPGELVVKTVTAVVRGLAQTVLDMTTMLFDIGGEGVTNEKGLIAICPSLSKYRVLSYSDHLRILLLMKFDGNGGADALKRCIHATMKNEYSEDIMPTGGEFNESCVWTTENYLGEYYTQVTATAEVDVDLYFIPMLLPNFINYGAIQDGKYKISTSVTYGY
ncbi:MAG: hypothetical protein HFE59_06175 [Clostridiales bacterium]|nr:hypothetical protein [Clostridiales bacterium]